jgi:hypothetical protein
VVASLRAARISLSLEMASWCAAMTSGFTRAGPALGLRDFKAIEPGENFRPAQDFERATY